jgi:hypothetical protein
VKRKIFPALLSRSERRALTKLSAKSRCSQSAAIRHLITHDAPLAKMCRDLIAQLLRDKTFRHRSLLIREIRHFIKTHGGVPELERLLQEHDR